MDSSNISFQDTQMDSLIFLQDFILPIFFIQIYHQIAHIHAIKQILVLYRIMIPDVDIGIMLQYSQKNKTILS